MNPEPLIKLIKQIEKHRNYNDYNNCLVKSPILVHCSAGIGRTGCFIAITLGMQQIDCENSVDVLNIVSRMRQQRLVLFFFCIFCHQDSSVLFLNMIYRGGSIQTLEQYEFVYQALAHYCINYKNHSRSPKLSSPSKCLQKFTFNTQTIQ
jgi:receptor-type tyrosine-protein phosphatase R